MTMPWFKMHDDAQNDAKLESLTDAQHRVWHRLMCFANKQEVRGTIPPMKPRLLALEVARGDVALLEETLEVLVDLEMLGATEDGGHAWLKWEKRQASTRKLKPSDDKERVKARVQRYRDNKRGDVTLLNKEVTPRNAPVTPSNATDIEEDREKEKEEEPPKPPLQKLPPQVQADIALRDYLVGKAEGLMSKGKLTHAARDTLKAWFTQHKHGLTVEMVDYAVSETALNTSGDALRYFCEVLERQLATGAGSNKAKPGGIVGSGKRETPPAGYSWDKDEGGNWKPLAIDPRTGLYPYDFENLDDVLEKDKEMLAVHMAKKQGLKVAIMPSGKRIPVLAGAA